MAVFLKPVKQERMKDNRLGYLRYPAVTRLVKVLAEVAYPKQLKPTADLLALATPISLGIPLRHAASFSGYSILVLPCLKLSVYHVAHVPCPLPGPEQRKA